MGLSFGYNCSNYLPTVGKCRVLSEQYRQRSDLRGKKWLKTQDLLVYMGVPHDELLAEISRESIRVRQLRVDGSLLFEVQASWAWDDCHERDTGGQCLYFQPHSGSHIRCMADLQDWPHEHPNLQVLPTDAEITQFEAEALAVAPAIIRGGTLQD